MLPLFCRMMRERKGLKDSEMTKQWCCCCSWSSLSNRQFFFGFRLMVNLGSKGVCLCLKIGGQITNKENYTSHLTYPNRMNAFLVQHYLDGSFVSTSTSTRYLCVFSPKKKKKRYLCVIFFAFGWSKKLGEELNWLFELFFVEFH